MEHGIKLRDYPHISYQGFHTWPPNWTWTGGAQDVAAKGEVGILKEVKTHDAISSKCFLFIEHEGATFMGSVSIDSWFVCQELVKLLKRHLGEPLRSIGGLEVSLMPVPVWRTVNGSSFRRLGQ
jgi:hypothetical protein